MTTPGGRFWGLYEQLKAGTISRRDFTREAAALGISPPVIAFILNTTKVAPSAPPGEPKPTD